MMRFRHRLKRLFAHVLVPVRAGPLKGYRFGLSAGAKFIRGTYGGDEAGHFQQLIATGDVVFDIGAHVGYYTLLAAQAAGPQGRVFAFEPLPLNLDFLHRHIRANRIENVAVLEIGIAASTGPRGFESGDGTGKGHLGAGEGGLQVETARLDDLYARGRIPCPDCIKMDIEGLEVEALEGAEKLLAECRPKLLLSLHGEAIRQECEALLQRHGYVFEYIKANKVLIARHTGE